MNYLYFFIFVFAINNIAEDYETIELSQTKKDLSKEVYSKLENGHFIKENDKKHFNERYVQAIFEKLDKNKNYFTNKEVNKYVMQSRVYNEYDFDIELAYELINLYFARMIDFSEFQIQLLKNDVFDFNKDEYLDIFYDDNKWATTYNQLEELWRLDTKNDLLVAKISDSASSNPNDDLIKRYKNRIRRINQQKEEDIFSIAINTLSNQFDPHSSYLNPEEYKESQIATTGEFGGLGIEINMHPKLKVIRVISPIADTPASRAGIMPGDLITHVNETSIKGVSMRDVVKKLRGPPGTSVRLTILRNQATIFKVSVVRAIIKIQPVKWYTEGNIGIIKVTHFISNSELALKSAIRELTVKLDYKLKGLVLDLRNNPGGLLNQSVAVADLFLEQGLKKNVLIYVMMIQIVLYLMVKLYGIKVILIMTEFMVLELKLSIMILLMIGVE